MSVRAASCRRKKRVHTTTQDAIYGSKNVSSEVGKQTKDAMTCFVYDYLPSGSEADKINAFFS